MKWGGKMYKFWMHSFANIRKTKSASITLVIMFIIAAFLLNSGLLVVFNYGNFFNSLKTELLPSDAYYLIPDKLYTNDIKKYMNESEHIKKVQINDAICLDSKILSNGEEKNFPILLNNMDENRDISKWKFVGEHLPAEDMSVYVPDIFKAVSGYELNDTIDIKYNDFETQKEKVLSFTVKGYTEDIYFSSTDTGFMGFYLTADTYEKVENILNDTRFNTNIAFTNVNDLKNISVIENEMSKILSLESSFLMAYDQSSQIFTLDLAIIDLSRCMMAKMISVMMVVFSTVIVIVCLLVVRFRIVNSIEEDVMKIGSLKSVGYTGGQIIITILLQFILIAGIGSILGIALSYPALPAVSAVFEQQSGLKWVQGFDAKISSISLFVLLLIVSGVSLLASRHINKLNPINALRGETTAYKHKKNYLQLEKTNGSLSFVLAFKSVLQSMKQNIMIVIILIAVTFSGAFGIVMFYNTAIDTKAFAEVPGYEICNVIAVFNPGKYEDSTIETIKNMDYVRKVQFLDQVKMKVDDVEISSFIMNDYSKRETNLVYDGRYPNEKNEITLAGILAERIGKKINDTVTVTVGDKEKTFNVVGLSNGSSMGGMNASILFDDYKVLDPDFKQMTLNIYLKEGTDTENFIDELNNNIEKEILLATTNFDKSMAEGMASYQNIVAIMGATMLVITLFVVALVLYFVISSSVIRKKRELGIQKAIGFTTFQLMNQLSISFIVPIIIGALIGSTLGALYTNSLMSITMKSAGVMRAGFIVNQYWIVIFCIATIVFSYFLSMFITLRIKKISAYSLVTE